MEEEAIIVGDMKIFINDRKYGDEEIYKGELIKLGKKVAVKRIRKDCFQDYRKHIERELRTVREIQDAKVSKLMDVNDYDTTVHEDYYYIAYDHFDTTLKSVIDEGIEDYDVKQILMNAVEGLEYLHLKEIFHRDIRTQNILIQNKIESSPVGALGKLSNFGLSKELQPGCNLQSISQELIPTGYIAPELFEYYKSDPKIKNKRQKCIDSSADVFSMGIVMFEALTVGIHPFSDKKEGNEQNNINKKIKPNFKFFDSKTVKLEKWEIEPAKQLIASTFQAPLKRPSASDMLKHPFFWSKEKIEKFFFATSGYMSGDRQLEKELENPSLDTTWANRLSSEMETFISNGSRNKSDPFQGTANLLRFVRNLVSLIK